MRCGTSSVRTAAPSGLRARPPFRSGPSRERSAHPPYLDLGAGPPAPEAETARRSTVPGGRAGIRREPRSFSRRRALPQQPPRRAGRGYGLLHRDGFRAPPPERRSGTPRRDPPRCCRAIGPEAPGARSIRPPRACSTPAGPGRSCRSGGGRGWRRRTSGPDASSPAGCPARRGVRRTPSEWSWP